MRNYRRIRGFRYSFLCVGFLLLLLSGCALLNTFYNAKAAFKRADKKHRKLKETTSDTIETLPSEIDEKYERAVKKSRKVIEVYPDKKKWHDDAVFLLGRVAFNREEWYKAIIRFKRLQEDYEDSDLVPESYPYLGKACLYNGDYAEADSIFNLILSKYPEYNSDNEITMLMAEAMRKRGNTSESIRILLGILEETEDKEKRIRIILKTGRMYKDMGMYSKAVDLLLNIPRGKKFTRLLFDADLILLKCYYELEEYDKALETAERMNDNSGYYFGRPRVYYYQGKALERQGLREEAVEVYESVLAEDGFDDIRARSAFRIAVYYQELSEYEKTKEYLEKVLSLSDNSELKSLARTRIEAIESVMSIASEIEEGDEAESNAESNRDSLYYRYGEALWLGMQEPDSAITYFRRISEDTAASEEMQRKSLYAREWLLRYSFRDTTGADSLARVIIQRFPGTEFAKEAQRDMGVEVDVMTRRDSAMQLFRNAEDALFRGNNPVKAVNTYNSVSRQYPEFRELKKRTLYAAADVLDNELNKNITAGKLYYTVCDTFPESSHCMDHAKPKLTELKRKMKVSDSELRSLIEQKAGGYSESSRSSEGGDSKEKAEESEQGNGAEPE
ncbi:MAG: tetratricopeptide repeat protein [Chitinivibrionales bacterium]